MYKNSFFSLVANDFLLNMKNPEIPVSIFQLLSYLQILYTFLPFIIYRADRYQLNMKFLCNIPSICKDIKEEKWALRFYFSYLCNWLSDIVIIRWYWRWLCNRLKLISLGIVLEIHAVINLVIFILVYFISLLSL